MLVGEWFILGGGAITLTHVYLMPHFVLTALFHESKERPECVPPPHSLAGAPLPAPCSVRGEYCVDHVLGPHPAQLHHVLGMLGAAGEATGEIGAAARDYTGGRSIKPYFGFILNLWPSHRFCVFSPFFFTYGLTVYTVLRNCYCALMMMMIGLNPGPRARTVKPRPRHLRTRPDPGQNRLGPFKGIPSGEARQCTPAGTEAVISALAPTAPPPIKAAQNATTVH